jgi:hypothetical protein
MAHLIAAPAVSASGIASTPRAQSATTGRSCASSISTNFGAAVRVVPVELRRDAQEGQRRE